MSAADPISAWMEALVARHTASLSRPEFLKAVRALSARYVERRAEIGQRSPTDSAGKRAAFAAFYTPLHALTVREVVCALGPVRPTTHVVDLGCGTGAAGAGYALACGGAPALLGIDRTAWALDEAQWNWRSLGLHGRTRRADMVTAALDLARRPRPGTTIVAAWSVNELDDAARRALRPALITLGRAGCSLLLVEPLARSAVPWWPAWADEWRRIGGRQDEWKFAVELPATLAELSEAAGFRRESLGARSLWVDATIR